MRSSSLRTTSCQERRTTGSNRIDADTAVGVIVSGFDSYVSYAYAGGTDLKGINVPE